MCFRVNLSTPQVRTFWIWLTLVKCEAEKSILRYWSITAAPVHTEHQFLPGARGARPRGLVLYTILCIESRSAGLHKYRLSRSTVPGPSRSREVCGKECYCRRYGNSDYAEWYFKAAADRECECVLAYSHFLLILTRNGAIFENLKRRKW